ncbi:hypothetical protein [Robiginitalea sp. IMCC43444]|uniref:hypothetical protein n=1 Tax=Robiginitalea sp. IMCC43444 TaxID=3459121 RepID=UPI004041F9A8
MEEVQIPLYIFNFKMRRFIQKLLLFGFLALTIISCILMLWGGRVDYFYNKFTSQKSASLIIGDSRSFQGIQPAILNEFLSDSYLELPILNYSFTIGQAPMGPLYNQSISKKILTNRRNGLFIISVTPLMFTKNKGYDHKKGQFPEANQPPHNMHFVELNPNFEYLLKNLSFFHFKAIFRGNAITHKDGWLEEKNISRDSLSYRNMENHQLKIFFQDSEIQGYSDVRLTAFNDLLKLLSSIGKVFVIRTPISNNFITKENEYFPNFNQKVDSMAQKFDVPFIDFNEHPLKHKFETYDGHHLNKRGGRYFTEVLSDSILSRL